MHVSQVERAHMPNWCIVAYAGLALLAEKLQKNCEPALHCQNKWQCAAPCELVEVVKVIRTGLKFLYLTICSLLCNLSM